MKNKPKTALQKRLINLIRTELSQLKEGVALSKEVDLANKYSVGRNTIRKVLTILEDDYEVVRIRGKGTFPAKRKLSCHIKRNPFRKVRIIFGLGLGGSSTFYNDILISVIHIAQRRNYHVEVSYIEYMKNKLDFCLDAVKDPYLEGLLLVAVTQKKIIEALYKTGVPICILDHYTELPIDVVDIASYKGSYEMTKKLIALGHKRIFYFDGKPKNLNPDRRQGYLDCMADFSLNVEKGWVQNFLPFEKGGKEAAEYYLHLPNLKRPTAIYFYSNPMAINFLQVTNAHGLRIPTELSICANGEKQIMTNEFTFSELTYNKYDGKKLGNKAFEHLLDRIQNTECPPKRTLIDPNFILGNSIGPNKWQ